MKTIENYSVFTGLRGWRLPDWHQNAILGALAAQSGCPEALADGFTWIYRDLGRSRSHLSGFDRISGISGVQGPESLPPCGNLWQPVATVWVPLKQEMVQSGRQIWGFEY